MIYLYDEKSDGVGRCIYNWVDVFEDISLWRGFGVVVCKFIVCYCVCGMFVLC